VSATFELPSRQRSRAGAKNSPTPILRSEFPSSCSPACDLNEAQLVELTLRIAMCVPSTAATDAPTVAATI
jgi:hypothetical protein